MSLSTEVCKTHYNLDKSDFEGLIVDVCQETIVLTDSQWEAIAKEIVGRLDNFMEAFLTDLIHDVCDGEYDEE